MLSEEKIVEIKKQLEKDVWIAAGMSAAVSTVPLPGVSLLHDFKQIQDYLTYYINSFRLDDASLNQLGKDTGKSAEYYRRFAVSTLGVLVLKDTAANFMTKAATDYVKQKLKEQCKEGLVRYVPMIGPVISGGLSAAATYYWLMAMIADLAEDAKAIYEQAAENTRRSQETMVKDSSMEMMEYKMKLLELENENLKLKLQLQKVQRMGAYPTSSTLLSDDDDC